MVLPVRGPRSRLEAVAFVARVELLAGRDALRIVPRGLVVEGPDQSEVEHGSQPTGGGEVLRGLTGTRRTVPVAALSARSNVWMRVTPRR